MIGLRCRMIDWPWGRRPEIGDGWISMDASDRRRPGQGRRTEFDDDWISIDDRLVTGLPTRTGFR